MKKYLDKFIYLVGVLSLLWLGLYFLSNHVLLLSHIEFAKKEFGTIEAKESMEKIFNSLKKLGIKTPGLIDLNSKYTKYDSVKRIPLDLLPEAFKGPGKVWGRILNHHSNLPEWGDVLAYFDAEDRLIGVEFYSSRYGAYISDSPLQSPESFNTLYRIQGGIIP